MGNVMHAHKIPLVSKYDDARGNIRKFFESDAQFGVSQVLTSFTRNANTFRGLHCQLGRNSEEKMIICNSGELIWLSVDFSKFNCHETFFESYLKIKAGEAVKIPKNCLNGMLSKSNNVSLTILASRPYSPNCGVTVNPFGDYFLKDFSMKNDLKSSKRTFHSDELSQNEFVKLL